MNYARPERVITITRIIIQPFNPLRENNVESVALSLYLQRASIPFSIAGSPAQKSHRGMSRMPLSSLIIGSLSQSGDSCDSTSTTLKGNSFRDIKKALPGSTVARRSLCLQFHTPRDVGCRNDHSITV